MKASLVAAACALALGAAGPAWAAPKSAAPAKPAAAAKTSGDVCAGGKYITLRISKITPNGTMEGFLDAVKLQNAWYQTHGFAADHTEVGRVLVMDEKTRAPGLAADEAVTLHYAAPGMAASGQKDDAWDTFVAKFKANATIETEKRLCVTG